MGVTTERLPRSLVALEIEVEPERLEAQMERAVRRLSQRVRIPGFRPGKAPRQIVERAVGRPALLQEALEQLLPDVYSEAIARESIDAIGQPSFELKSTEPLVVSATVPVRPTVELGDYRELRAPKPQAQVRPEQVEEAIDALRRRYATLEPVDRAVQWGDTVRVDVKVEVDGQAEPHEEEGAEFRVTKGGQVSLPGFLDHLIGLERGGPHRFEFTLPEDFAARELAGKTARYEVRLHEVKQEVLPDLDDAFVRSLDEEGIETVAQLRERVEQNVRARAEAEAEAAYRDEVLDLLVAGARLDYPEVLVEREVDRLIDQQSNHAAHTREELDRWLQAIGQTEEEVREGLRPRADLAVRRALVLGRLAEAEGLSVTDEQVDAEVERIVDRLAGVGAGGSEATDERRQSLRGMFDTPESRSSLRNQLLTEATLARLVEIASQPEAEEAGEEPRVRGSRRRRGVRAGGEHEAEGAAVQAEAAEEHEGDQQAPAVEGTTD